MRPHSHKLVSAAEVSLTWVHSLATRRDVTKGRNDSQVHSPRQKKPTNAKKPDLALPAQRLVWIMLKLGTWVPPVRVVALNLC